MNAHSAFGRQTYAFIPTWRCDRVNFAAIPAWPERRSYIAQRKAARAARRTRRASR